MSLRNHSCSIFLDITVFIFLLMTTTVSAIYATKGTLSTESQQFSDSWVVEVDGGKEKANELAARHGFINLGEVEIFSLLCMCGDGKRC